MVGGSRNAEYSAWARLGGIYHRSSIHRIKRVIGVSNSGLAVGCLNEKVVRGTAVKLEQCRRLNMSEC